MEARCNQLQLRRPLQVNEWTGTRGWLRGVDFESLVSSSEDLASARKSLRRGLGPSLGPGWFAERFHSNALVTHLQHGQGFCPARQLKDYAVTRCRLHQRAPERGHPTYVVAVEINFVGAHNAHQSLRSRGIGIAHGRAEKCFRRCGPCSRSFRVHHFRGLDSLGEKANPAINLAQPPLAVLIVGVFTAIAIAGCPRHNFRYRRTFPGEQKPVLIFEALEPARCDVVLDGRRGLVRLWLSGKPLAHFVIFSRFPPQHVLFVWRRRRDLPIVDRADRLELGEDLSCLLMIDLA